MESILPEVFEVAHQIEFMDVFQRYQYQNNKLDDTQEITCVIETVQNINGHTEYLLRFQRGPLKQNTWRLLKRYNDFAELHKYFSKLALSLPGKRLYGNMRPEFIAERRQALQIYINTILMNPILASSLPAKRFVDPDNYSQSFHDQAVQNTLLSLKHENLWTLGRSLGAIGWRLRKHYFSVTPKAPDVKQSNRLLMKSSSHSLHNQNKTNNGINIETSTSSTSAPINKAEDIELVLEWCEYGPDKYIEDKEIGSILKSLMCVQHPNIEPIIYATHNENGCLIIRRFYKHGSLKDILYMATPKNTFLNKYGNPKGRVPINIKKVAIYGKQILEGLTFLHSKGLPYGHLHSGNVLIVNDCAKLLDVENYIIGVPAFYRPFFLQHSKIHSPESIDVYSFGHVLFEMAMGYPLQDSIMHKPPECQINLKDLLESILSREACKSGLPTLQQLLQHKFFEEFTNHEKPTTATALDGTKSFLKFTLNAKEVIKQAIQKSEGRLREEQKSIKTQKRIVRVQGLMSSEEEKRKCKQKEKLEHKQFKLRQQYSLQTNNDVNSSAASTSITDEAEHHGANAKQMSSTEMEKILRPPLLMPVRAYNLSEQQEQQHQQSNLKKVISVENVDTQSLNPNMPIVDDHSASNITVNNEENELDRSALFESICKFNRGSLRKIRSKD